MSITENARRKAEYVARKLVHEVMDLHFAYQRVPGRVVPGGAVEFDNLDVVQFALDHVLVSIRTLDQLYEGRHEPTYEALRGVEGRVVSGLVAPRDAAVHGSELIEPDLARAVQFEEDFIVFPRWKARSDVPASVFERRPELSKSAYDDTIAGRALHDTILDAIKFFDHCDSTIFQRSDDGTLKGLPLPPLPIGGYFRIHPDWPSHEEVGERLRVSIQTQLPAGTKRKIDGIVVTTDGTPYVCGYTQMTETYGSVFTEASSQVAADIALGYRYEVTGADGSVHPVKVDAGGLIVEGRPIGEAGLPDLGASYKWAGIVELAASDVWYYADQRR
jgi:hypothetical protein